MNINLYRRTVIVLLTLFLCSAGMAQENGAESPPRFEPLPRSFRALELGMNMDDVKEELEKDGYFLYRGEPDVSMLSRPESALIECRGMLYIDRAFFQFNGDVLYTMIINLNPVEIDYFSMYTRLTEKYGDPETLDPAGAVWSNDSVRLSLERPLTVKYIDLDIFNRIREESQVEESFQAETRDRFLDLF